MGEPLPGFEKGRYRDPSQRRLYPVSAFNSACARPLSFLLGGVGFTPNQVSLLSLLVSVWGLARMADGAWPHMVQGALLVHLGLLLDHADGQVARRKNKGTTWGMYLDMLFDRVVEIGLIVALAIAGAHGVSGLPAAIPAPWTPLGASWFLIACIAAVGAMMLWRFLNAYNDLLYLRGHLLQTQRAPGPTVVASAHTTRPVVSLVFNRDWVLLVWVGGVLLGQLQATVVLLLVLHVEQSLEKVVAFALRHKKPEGDASRIVGKDYH